MTLSSRFTETWWRVAWQEVRTFRGDDMHSHTATVSLQAHYATQRDADKRVAQLAEQGHTALAYPVQIEPVEDPA